MCLEGAKDKAIGVCIMHIWGHVEKSGQQMKGMWGEGGGGGKKRRDGREEGAKKQRS